MTITTEKAQIVVNDKRVEIVGNIHAHLDIVRIRVNESLDGTVCNVNGIAHTVDADFSLTNGGEWMILWNSLYLRRIEPKAGTLFDRDPTPNARTAVREMLTAAVSEWAKRYPEALAEGVEEARKEFQNRCNSTLAELQAEITRLTTAAIESAGWDQERLTQAVERRESYAHNFSVR